MSTDIFDTHTLFCGNLHVFIGTIHSNADRLVQTNIFINIHTQLIHKTGLNLPHIH